ncbi:radical SAM protein [Desertibaculum subflavum]|uniref:radical SAM protein n=1 Tax=Desertibaculum subflavum TaxID=2268458 RepID=UPI000E6671A4
MNAIPLDPRKFRDPFVTAKGETRATVAPTALRTLWFNTGTLCNIACEGCYIESSPKNDRLAYLSLEEVRGYLDEIGSLELGTEEIGFTGGEPFMNRDLPAMIALALERGFRVMVLTNAMRSMQRLRREVARLPRERLTFRVSLDHHTAEGHERVRGERSWRPALDGLRWLVEQGFNVHVAARAGDEPEGELRAGFARLFAEIGLPLAAADPVELVVFPEMDERVDVPEITTACWGILKRSPDSMMCATSRMVVKRKGAAGPAVLACTLIAYDAAFELGRSLAEALKPVPLNHPHCAKFCVLGGAACSR